MASGIYIAMAGSVAQQRALDVTANNIANASTTGFHADRVTFQQAFAGARKDSASVRDLGPTADPTEGALVSTGNQLDVAISGPGYLVVSEPAGQRLSRGGALRVDATSQLVTPSGAPVLGQDGRPIRIPPAALDVSIGAQGAVTADGVEVGRIRLVSAASVRHESASTFVAQGPLGPAPVTTELVSGSVEESNFSVMRGMADLVRISRTYEALHRMIESYKQIDERSARIGNG